MCRRYQLLLRLPQFVASFQTVRTAAIPDASTSRLRLRRDEQHDTIPAAEFLMLPLEFLPFRGIQRLRFPPCHSIAAVVGRAGSRI
jgi:hypothetical protein